VKASRRSQAAGPRIPVIPSTLSSKSARSKSDTCRAFVFQYASISVYIRLVRLKDVLGRIQTQLPRLLALLCASVESQRNLRKYFIPRMEAPPPPPRRDLLKSPADFSVNPFESKLARLGERGRGSAKVKSGATFAEVHINPAVIREVSRRDFQKRLSESGKSDRVIADVANRRRLES